jgi:hypothetical protein
VAAGTTQLNGSQHQQRGAALLILLTIIVLAASYTLLKRLNRGPVAILQASDNAGVLGEARTALAGYALKSTTRPGELPCPDTDNDGYSNVASGCSAYVGRLPWKTLGLGDLRDASGERLWYALDTAFDGATAINSDTAASLVLDGDTGRHYAALIFAPGQPVLNTQARPPAAQNNVARYLEDDNANGDGNFVSTLPSDFNDQVLALGDTELLQAVEHRVLGELKSQLKSYFFTNNYYPYPALLNGTDCDVSSNFQGQVPITISGAPSCSSLADWGPNWPAWFAGDGWNLLVWYAVAPACTQATPNCAGPGGFVTVDGTADKQAIVITAGPRRSGQSRPAGLLSDLLDAGVNNDGTNLIFQKLPLDANSNDQILIVAP